MPVFLGRSKNSPNVKNASNSVSVSQLTGLAERVFPPVRNERSVQNVRNGRNTRKEESENQMGMPTMVGILAFELGSIMRKSLEIWDCMQDKDLQALRHSLQLPGVTALISRETGRLWALAGAEKHEELRVLRSRVQVLGLKCRDPALVAALRPRFNPNLDPNLYPNLYPNNLNLHSHLNPNLYPNHNSNLHPNLHSNPNPHLDPHLNLNINPNLYPNPNHNPNLNLGFLMGHDGDVAVEPDAEVTPRDAELLVRFMKEQTDIINNLKWEMEALQLLYGRVRLHGEMNRMPDILTQRDLILKMQAGCVWSEDLDTVVRIMILIISMLRKRVMAVFGTSTSANALINGSLGEAGLALHYANIVMFIEKVFKDPSLVLSPARDELYQMLPREIQVTVRRRLRERDSVSQSVIEERLKKSMALLPALAKNTASWQSAHTPGSNYAPKSTVFRVQTFEYAEKAAVNKALVHVLVGLCHVCAADDDEVPMPYSVSLKQSPFSGRRSESDVDLINARPTAHAGRPSESEFGANYFDSGPEKTRFDSHGNTPNGNVPNGDMEMGHQWDDRTRDANGEAFYANDCDSPSPSGEKWGTNGRNHRGSLQTDRNPRSYGGVASRQDSYDQQTVQRQPPQLRNMEQGVRQPDMLSRSTEFPIAVTRITENDTLGRRQSQQSQQSQQEINYHVDQRRLDHSGEFRRTDTPHRSGNPLGLSSEFFPTVNSKDTAGGLRRMESLGRLETQFRGTDSFGRTETGNSTLRKMNAYGQGDNDTFRRMDSQSRANGTKTPPRRQIHIEIMKGRGGPRGQDGYMTGQNYENGNLNPKAVSFNVDGHPTNRKQWLPNSRGYRQPVANFPEDFFPEPVLRRSKTSHSSDFNSRKKGSFGCMGGSRNGGPPSP